MTSHSANLEADSRRLTVTFKGQPADGGELPRVSKAECTPLIAHIAATSPMTLHLVCDLGIPGEAWTAACTGQQLRSVRALIFDAPFARIDVQTLNGNSLGDLAAVCAAFPSVERAFFAGALELRSPLALDALTDLHLCGNPLDASIAEMLARSTLPSLQRCAIVCGSEVPGNSLLFLRAIAQMTAPQLSTVLVTVPGDQLTKVLRDIVDRVASRWRRLSFAITSPLDEDEFLAHLANIKSSRLGNLEIGLDIDDWLSTPGVAKAKRLLPALRQRDEWARNATSPRAYKTW